jgi:hypothetical protein
VRRVICRQSDNAIAIRDKAKRPGARCFTGAFFVMFRSARGDFWSWTVSHGDQVTNVFATLRVFDEKPV